VSTIVAGSREFTDYIFLKKVLGALSWRIEELVRYSEALVVFRYPYSRGSAHMLEIAKRTTNIALIKDVVLT
jgi:hypothetical protein